MEEQVQEVQEVQEVKQAEPKYRIGDTVWIMRDNKTYSFSIYGVMLRKDMPVAYNEEGHIKTWYYEDMLYATKEELLKSL